jgi:hypothetical protein
MNILTMSMGPAANTCGSYTRNNGSMQSPRVNGDAHIYFSWLEIRQ